MSRYWSTGDVHPRDRLAYWIDAVCDCFVRLDCEQRRDRPLFCELHSDPMGELKIAKVTERGIQSVTRSPRHIAHAPAAFFYITVQLAGQCRLSQDGRDVILRPGDFALHDSVRPFSLRFDDDVVQTVLQIPRAALLTQIGPSECFTAIRIDGDTGVGGVLSPTLAGLPTHVPAICMETRARRAGNLLDIIATALLSHGPPASLAAEKTLTRIKLWIETKLGEQLSAEYIAASCRLSVRHLNRLFEREGTSLMRYVWERRLGRCHRDLIDPAMRHRSVGEIAFASGFNDLSHFSRAYRARYNCSPRGGRAVVMNH
jgi:AraC-like DNA-binding protein